MKTPVPYRELYRAGRGFSTLENRGAAPPWEKGGAVAERERLGGPRLPVETAEFRGATLPHRRLQKGDCGAPAEGTVAYESVAVGGAHRGSRPRPRRACKAKGSPRPSGACANP